jgi:hypothetical protein
MPSERTLQTRINRIKRALLALGDLRPGTLSKQYNVCGNPKCRCKAEPPRKHGPYYQVSFTRKGRSRTEFIRKGDLPSVRTQIRNYDKLRKLIDEWLDLSIELDRLRRSTNR